MKWRKIFFFIFSAILIFSVKSFTADLSPKDIALNVFHRDVGKNSEAEARMLLIDKNNRKKARDFSQKRVKKNRLEKNLIVFRSPAEIEGTAFLTIEKKDWETDQFLYLPALKRTRRIVSSQKDQKFVNSDFTYEDMERHPVDNYSYKLLDTKKFNNLDCYVLESTPLKNTDSQYSKTVSYIHQDSFVTVYKKFYLKKNKLFKEYKVLALETIQNIPTEIVVSMETIKTNHKTFIKIDNIKYNTNISPEDLSREKLKFY
jgi:hypothetical protein